MHPAHLVDGDDLTLVRLAIAAEGAPSGTLPESGGILDQAACTMESIAVVNATRTAIRIAQKPATPER